MNKHDTTRDYCMLKGKLDKRGYDWWWNSFTAVNAKTGEAKPFYIEFFGCNPGLQEDKPVLGQEPENKKAGKKPSYLMVNVGWWGAPEKGQLHNFYAWKDLKFDFTKPLDITAGNCTLTETATKGTVKVTPEQAANPGYMCDAGEMSWDLKIDKKVAFNVGYGASKFFRNLNAFEMFWHAEGMKTAFSGKIVLNGEVYNVSPETCYGYSDKNWGGDFTSPWVWLSSNNLVSKKTGKKLEDSVFNIGGGRPKILGVALNRKLLSDFWYEGKSYEFNFSKFWTVCRTKFEGKEDGDLITWYVRQETVKYVMETHIYCKKEDMIFINYEAPDGRKLHNRLWNCGCGWGNIKLFEKRNGELNLIDEVEAKNVGCEYGEYDK